MSYVLLTGGAGYIGSHIALALLKAGDKVISFDNYSNSSTESLNRVERLLGKSVVKIEGDIRDREALSDVFRQYPVKAVIHLAALKAVGESVQKPLNYYETNVGGTVTLLQVMEEFNVKRLVFSSSATVYGSSSVMPIPETAQRSATNPYGRTKLMIEDVLSDLYKSDDCWSIAVLRYFNPVGADESGLIGEDPNDTPNNLMPFITQVAVGKRQKLNIFGIDYETVDGTGVRDFIHVTDLATGHLSALQYLEGRQCIDYFNLGTGKGCSVLELVNCFRDVNQVEVPYEIVERRKGDTAMCYASADKAREVLGWRALKSLEDMVRDSWRWQRNNPNGYYNIK